MTMEQMTILASYKPVFEGIVMCTLIPLGIVIYNKIQDMRFKHAIKQSMKEKQAKA